jgi:hypothetical protein
MIDLQLASNNDLVISNGDISLTSDGTEVAQNAGIRLRTVKGEWVLDPSIGIDFELFFSSMTTMAYKEAIIRKVVYQTTGVKQINKCNLVTDQGNMTLYIDLEVTTDFATGQSISLVF